jgi:integrase
MQSRLSDRQVQALKAEKGKRLEVFDTAEPGLLIRVSETGRRTWFYRYRLPDGRQPRLKLGTYPSTSIADARERARNARKSVEAGEDPGELERKAELEARAQKVRTFDDLIQAYFAACEDGSWIPKGRRKKDKTIESERKLYERHIKKVLSRLSITAIGRAEIRAVTQGMFATGIRTQCNHAQALIRQAFSYALDQELVGINPAMAMSAPAPKNARERVLSDAELKSVWNAFKTPGGVKDENGKSPQVSKGVGMALRLTALLLQRRVEVATMRVQDIDLEHGVWRIPGDRVKNGRPHAVPLPPSALQLIKDALAIRKHRESPWVFPSPRGNGRQSIDPDALTRAMGHVTHALKLQLAGPHDLRRTGTTLLSSERIGITPFNVSQVLNHTTDAGGGSATTRRHYNVNLYAAEKRHALEQWEKLLLEIVGAGSANSKVAVEQDKDNAAAAPI